MDFGEDKFGPDRSSWKPTPSDLTVRMTRPQIAFVVLVAAFLCLTFFVFGYRFGQGGPVAENSMLTDALAERQNLRGQQPSGETAPPPPATPTQMPATAIPTVPPTPTERIPLAPPPRRQPSTVSGLAPTQAPEPQTAALPTATPVPPTIAPTSRPTVPPTEAPAVLPATPAPVSEQRTTTGQAARNVYTVQIGSFEDEANARRLKGRLEDARFEAYIQEVVLGPNTTHYRVQVGSLDSRRQANRIQRQLQGVGFPKGFVTAVVEGSRKQ